MSEITSAPPRPREDYVALRLPTAAPPAVSPVSAPAPASVSPTGPTPVAPSAVPAVGNPTTPGQALYRRVAWDALDIMRSPDLGSALNVAFGAAVNDLLRGSPGIWARHSITDIRHRFGREIAATRDWPEASRRRLADGVGDLLHAREAGTKDYNQVLAGVGALLKELAPEASRRPTPPTAPFGPPVPQTTPAKTTPTKTAPVETSPVETAESRIAAPPAAKAPSPLPPAPVFESTGPTNPIPKGPTPEQIAKEQAALDTRFAYAAEKLDPAWSRRHRALADLGRDLSNRATGPQANAANALFAQTASLVDRGGRLASAVAAAEAGKRTDVIVSGRNLPLAEARAELGRLTTDADRSLAALKAEIGRLPKAPATTSAPLASANPFDAPQRPGPGVTLPAAKPSLDHLSPEDRKRVEEAVKEIEEGQKLGFGNPVETAIERLKRGGHYEPAMEIEKMFPGLVQASTITPRPSSPTARRSETTATAEPSGSANPLATATDAEIDTQSTSDLGRTVNGTSPETLRQIPGDRLQRIRDRLDEAVRRYYDDPTVHQNPTPQTVPSQEIRALGKVEAALANGQAATPAPDLPVLSNARPSAATNQLTQPLALEPTRPPTIDGTSTSDAAIVSSPRPEAEDVPDTRSKEWDDLFERPTRRDPGAAPPPAGQPPGRGDRYEFVTPVTGESIRFDLGQTGFMNPDGTPIGPRQGSSGIGADIAPGLDAAQREERRIQLEWAVFRAINETVRSLTRGDPLDEAIDAGKATLRRNPDAEKRFDRQIGPAIWSRREQFAPKRSSDAGIPSLSAAKAPAQEVSAGSSQIEQAVGSLGAQVVPPAAAADFDLMLGAAVEGVERARRALGQKMREGAPMTEVRNAAFRELDDNPVSLQMFLGSLESAPIYGVTASGLLGAEKASPTSLYEQIHLDPRTAFQRYEIPEHLRDNPYSDANFVPDLEFRVGGGLKVGLGLGITDAATGETMFGSGYQMASVAALPFGNRVWGLLWANRFQILNSPNPVAATGESLRSAVGFGIRSDLLGTDPQLVRNSNLNPFKLGKADLLSFKNGDLKPALIEWVRSGHASDGLRFVPAQGERSIAVGTERTTGQATVTVTGRLEIDVTPYVPRSYGGAKDFFGQTLRPDTQYYRLETRLATKPLRETYLSFKTPFSAGGKTLSSSVEFRFEPNAATKVSIPEGAILPAWFVETFNARFGDLEVGVRGVSPNPDGSLGGSPTSVVAWLRGLIASHPENVEAAIGTENPLYPGVQRLSAVPGKKPTNDALGFDVRFGHLESAVRGSPDKLVMPDIYGTLYPGKLNNSKWRIRTGLNVNLMRLGDVRLGPVVLKLPSANAELIGQLLSSGATPGKLVTSGERGSVSVTIDGVDRTVDVPRWVEVWLDKSLSEGVASSGVSTPASHIALPVGGKASLTAFLEDYGKSLPPDAVERRRALADFRADVLPNLQDGSSVDGASLDRLVDLLVLMSDHPSLLGPASTPPHTAPP